MSYIQGLGYAALTTHSACNGRGSSGFACSRQANITFTGPSNGFSAVSILLLVVHRHSQWFDAFAGKDEAGVAKYDARITYATPTPGLAEVEPSMKWNPSVVAGIGVVMDPAPLYNDMHSYLAESGKPWLTPADCS